jgi:uncharacterized protein (TIGR03118 family)
LTCRVLFLAVCFLPFPALAGGYVQTNLASDGFVPAHATDPNLINPWGISFSATSPFWVSNNGTGKATVYNGDGQQFPVGSPLVVTVPPPSGLPGPSAPTGQVYNSFFNTNTSFNGNVFIFATEGGTIAGWRGALGTAAETLVDNSSFGAIYKGLALGNIAGNSYLYAANFARAAIDVFPGVGAPALTGNFLDPNMPVGYAPFNIQNLGGTLFVTYAMVDSLHPGDELHGPGLGIVSEFDLNGNLVRRIISPGGALNAPWGLALSPINFGEFSNVLLVANVGDGRINAFDPVTGNLLGTLKGSNGNPIVIDGLRGLIFGNGGNGGKPDKLYFTAGIGGQQHGLLGSLASVVANPALSILLLM